jgi:hypothetical protein
MFEGFIDFLHFFSSFQTVYGQLGISTKFIVKQNPRQSFLEARVNANQNQNCIYIGIVAHLVSFLSFGFAVKL